MNRLHKNISAESIFLASVILVAAWMLYRTFSFNWSTAFYPRWMSILVLVCVGFIILTRSIPERFLERFRDDTTSTYGDIDTRSVDEKQSMLVAGQFALYIASCYVFGFLISSIWYVFAILQYYNYGGYRERIVYTVITGAIVYLGYQILGVDLTFGAIFNQLGL